MLQIKSSLAVLLVDFGCKKLCTCLVKKERKKVAKSNYSIKKQFQTFCVKTYQFSLFETMEFFRDGKKVVEKQKLRDEFFFHGYLPPIFL